MEPRDLNSLRLEGRYSQKNLTNHVTLKKKKEVLLVGKTDLDKDRDNQENTSTVSCFVS